jgi:hypothetical protein
MNNTRSGPAASAAGWTNERDTGWDGAAVLGYDCSLAVGGGGAEFAVHDTTATTATANEPDAHFTRVIFPTRAAGSNGCIKTLSGVAASPHCGGQPGGAVGRQ